MNNFLLNIEKQTAYLTVNRPEKMNALNRATLLELSIVLRELAGDERVRGIILTGSGDKAFVAGADIAELANLSKAEALELSSWGHEQVMDVLYNFPKPVVAALNGYTLGGGLELALSCHIRIASEHAKMGLPEVSLGLIPGYGGTQRLPALVGRGKAMEMILTGDMIGAQDAYAWGLVNKVVPHESLIAEAEAILAKMYQRSPAAIAAAVAVVNQGLMKPKSGAEAEMTAFSKAFASADFEEGVSAFLAKRKPNF